MKVDVLHNITRDDEGRMAIYTRPYDEIGAPAHQPGDTLQVVGTMDAKEQPDARAAAEQMWVAGNSPEASVITAIYRSWRVRSLCMGDVVRVHTGPDVTEDLVAVRTGWEPVDLSTYVIIEQPEQS